MTSNNGASAFNPTVRTNEPYDVVQPEREQRADDMVAAVTHIEGKIAALEADNDADPKWRKTHLAALRKNLESATAEAEQARREAQEGAQ